MPDDKAIIIKNLTKTYGKTNVLNDISIEIERGDFFVIMGPSPSGKTTLLRCITGLEKPTIGSIYVNGQDVKDIIHYKRNIPLMFQNYALFPHLNVFDNIAFGLRMHHYPKAKIKEETEYYINLVGLEGLGKRGMRELSGGQQQRVALARTLVVKSDFLMLDEPLGNLDAKLQRKMMDDIKEIHNKLNLTTIYVTHSLEQAMSLGEKIVILNAGRIEQEGPPEELYLKPESLFVSRFTGQLNTLPGKIVAREENTINVETNVGLLKGIGKVNSTSQKAIYAIRPENIMFEDGIEKCDNKIDAKLLEQIYKGPDMEYYAQLKDGTTFTIFKKGDQIVNLDKKVGEKIPLGWNTDKAQVFDKASATESFDKQP